ncbi:hypothetical protein FTW19_22995 [Terriglobus albidus]|uniref:Uncharacterized protein n=1 Tax=Terriglobus albidus TaxID=1592106 RepID=A0A5B9EEL1_9BACT|nr:hypothetical protein [Terriglobus albidus]QEE30603.1 hypothetical protein FTW19_22995 [Terriglobus albidus]
MSALSYLVEVVFWGAVGLLIAGISSVLLVKSASRLQKSFWTVVSCGAVPFIGLLWLAFIVLFVHVKISNKWAHQDSGMSGDPYVTLPNGYRLESGNTYDDTLVAPGFHSDVPIAGPGYVRSIIHLKIDGDEFVGDQYCFETDSIRPFRFDMKTMRFEAPECASTQNKTFGARGDEAGEVWGDAQTHARFDTDGFWALYDRYRHHWPNYVLAVLIILGEGALILGVRRLLGISAKR